MQSTTGVASSDRVVAPAPVTVDFTQFLEPTVHVVQVVQVPHLQIIETVETLVSLSRQGTQTSTSLGHAPFVK